MTVRGLRQGRLDGFKNIVTDLEYRSRRQFDLALEFGLPAHVEASGDLAAEHHVLTA
ncbi:hypothetical protein D3C87_1538730 [compost metagenome]